MTAETGEQVPGSDQAPRAFHPSELPEHLKEALGTTRMDPRHDHLNGLMDGAPKAMAAP